MTNTFSKSKIMNYTKQHAVFDLESVKHHYLVGVTINSQRFLLVGGDVIPSNLFGAQLITLSKMKAIVNNNFLIGFNNNNYDDYVLKAILDGKSPEEVNELSQKIISSKIAPFRWDPQPASLWATFDIRSVMPNKPSLKELASHAGLNVEEYELDFNLQRKLTVDEITGMTGYMFNDIDVTASMLQHPAIMGKLSQHIDSIENYLPGQDYAISFTDSALAVRAMTKSKTLKSEKKKKFTWMLNGHYVLDAIPDQWKNALLEYAKNLEEAYQEFEKVTSNGTMDERTAGKEIMKKVPLPAIDPILYGTTLFKPSIGGIHTHYVSVEDGEPKQVTARFRDVHHRDISGAYSMVARATNLFGHPEIMKIYNGFIDDKFAAKKTNNKGLVSASKLMTNAPTGDADRPGSPLYNPIAITENRVMLQILLYTAAKIVIDNGGQVLSVNTDGLFYVGDEEIFKPLFDAWEEKWQFSLSYEHVDAYIGKDDANRILINDGKIIETSGEVVHQEFNPMKLGPRPRIVDYAVVQKLTHKNVSIEDILDKAIENNRADLLAWTIKAPANHRTEINYEIANKVNRVLLTTQGDHIGMYNLRTDKIDAITNLPDSPVTLINEKYPETLPENINREAYLEAINAVYEHWL